MGCHGSKSLGAAVLRTGPAANRFEPEDLGDDRAETSHGIGDALVLEAAHARPIQLLEAGPRSLCSSAANGDLAAVRVLLACGVPVNEEVGGDGTALHWAARMGRREVVEVLLEAGADVSVMNAQGYTPYAVARDWSPTRDVVTLLEQRCPSRSGVWWDR